MTAALEGGEWSVARPGRTLPPGKTRCPLYRRLGRPQGRSGRAEKLVPTGIRSRTVQIREVFCEKKGNAHTHTHTHTHTGTTFEISSFIDNFFPGIFHISVRKVYIIN